MTALLIVNPVASAVDDERLAAVEDALPRDLRTVRTEARGHATELAREAHVWAEAIYVFSGDGGFNEALNGADGSVPFGFVPGGGTSVLPRALGLPRDPVEAARRVAAGRRRRISLGRANGRRFGFNAGLGLDAELVRRVDELGRAPDGKRPSDFRFAWTAIRTLAERRARFEPALEVDGLGTAAFALVANTNPYTYLGKLPLRVAPAAAFEGGLDLVAPRRVTPLSVPRFATYLVRGRGQDRARDVLYVHDADRLVVRCAAPMPLQLDGEDVGDVEEVVFEAERDAVDVFV